jgi:rhamnogalacturonyl hydrolase YesR
MPKIAEEMASLRAYVEQRDFAGYDPFDALNSPLLRTACMGNKWARIACIQFLRRFPVNVRPGLLIPKGHNPKALGLFLEGYARLYSLDPNDDYLDTIRRLIGYLQATKSATASGHGWGYNFDWQSRAFFVPKFTPTIVNSAFVGHALLDVAEARLDSRALDLALPVGDFILNDLHRVVEGDTFCFCYTPRDRYAVHNASLLGASFLIRLWKLSGRAALRDAALPALAYSMRHQRKDGSWYYAERAGSHWIDSFHTGFNLEAARRFTRAGEGGEWLEHYGRGRAYYRDNFFLADGTPKYYHDRVYPIDIHSPAQAVAFFSEEGGDHLALADQVLAWMMKNLRDKKGYFHFRKSPRFTNRIPYMRWGQAWAFRALVAWHAARCGRDQGTPS